LEVGEGVAVRDYRAVGVLDVVVVVPLRVALEAEIERTAVKRYADGRAGAAVVPHPFIGEFVE
jgi:hypothetical protein